MSPKTKAVLAGMGVLVLAAGAFVVLSGRAEDLPIVGDPEPDICPLSGREPRRAAAAGRPAVAVKIENAAAARPLSGIERAELVYEEVVEGGETRFLAFFHCTDAPKAGPIRSARVVDPALLMPVTRILGYSGANELVTRTLDDAGVVSFTEVNAGDAMERVSRPGVASEHTLYVDTPGLRRLGRPEFDDPPPETFAFGEPDRRGRRASSISINFGGASTVRYEWSEEGWLRFQDDMPFVAESGDHIAPTNILVEEHTVDFSTRIRDSAGNPSIEISDETGRGRAVLFRNGRAFVGRWIREAVEDPVSFVTRDGEEMVFAPGSIWIELVPNDRGEVKGSFTYGDQE